MRGLAAAAMMGLAVLGAIGCATTRVDIPTGAPLITVLTWNVHSGRGDLSRLAADLDSRSLASPAAPASLLLLQEVTAAEVDAIAAPRGWATAFIQVRGDDSQQGNAILSSVALTEPRVLPLPRERQPRAAVAARITVAGTRLFVVSVHLENRESWMKGGLSGDTARKSQVQALLRALPANEPGILGGDLNTWLGAGEPAWRALTARFNSAPDWPDAPTFRGRLVLDHVLMDLPPGWRVTTRVLPDDYGSDHHPVTAVVWGRSPAST
jgi:endonuclease/exonuclease/phosphatase family metal-dependent hydrolase